MQPGRFMRRFWGVLLTAALLLSGHASAHAVLPSPGGAAHRGIGTDDVCSASPSAGRAEGVHALPAVARRSNPARSHGPAEHSDGPCLDHCVGTTAHGPGAWAPPLAIAVITAPERGAATLGAAASRLTTGTTWRSPPSRGPPEG